MTRELSGTAKDCKSKDSGSIPARVSTKYKALSQMHWFWRWIYWPLRHLVFYWIEYPLIQKTNAFMEPIRKEQAITRKALYERDRWKDKYISISKENAELKRAKI